MEYIFCLKTFLSSFLSPQFLKFAEYWARGLTFFVKFQCGSTLRRISKDLILKSDTHSY